MEIRNAKIDGGDAFDWGRTSADYALSGHLSAGILRTHPAPELRHSRTAHAGSGNGTGVLPRNLVQFGGIWTGTDISENQIAKARELSAGMPIDYTVSSAETVSFPDNTFDGITACQCYWYFDDAKVAPRLFRMLKPGGKLLLLCMAWLPFEDPVACASEQLVLRYSPNWSGAGETLHPIPVSPDMQRQLRLTFHEEYLLDVPFTRESWNGRMKACRGIGASLPPEQIARWEQEHRKMLAELAPEHFTVRHYAALAELQKPE
ncbi:MAG: class I SAM-dependent methyltransferase [Ruminococcus sp.]